MAENKQDVHMQEQQPQEAGEEKIPTGDQDMEKELDIDQVRSTLNTYKLDVFKNKDMNVEGIVKDLRLTLDRIDNGRLPKSIDQLMPAFIKLWSERKFHKIEINIQAIINGFFQYWMYKRVKKDTLTKENLKTLRLILNDDAYFYSIQFTKEVMKEAKEEIEAVKKVNPVLYTHVDDFTEIKRTIYSPYFTANVESFCKLDGFAEVIKTLDDGKELNIDQLREYFDICISTAPFLKKDFKMQIFSAMIEKILDLFKSFPDEKLKSISQDNLEKFINCFEFVLEGIHEDDRKNADEIVQKFELELALRFLNTPYIEKRVHGLNILISKVNLINRSSFECSWKRKMFVSVEDLWLTSEIFLQWLLDHDIFGLFFGEKLHSEMVVKYYAVLSFLYSKDKLNEKHLELIWDCAINKHDAYRVNILKVLSTLSLKMKPSHAKFLFEKLKQLEFSEYCKFILQLLKHLNKNSCKGPMTDKAAQEAGFGKTQRREDFSLGDILNIQAIDLTGLVNKNKREKKTRSFSLGGDEKDSSKPSKGRHNSPDATGRRLGDVYPSINVGSLEMFPSETLMKKEKRNRSIEKVKNIFDIEFSKEEIKVEIKKQNEHQSTDEEDKEKAEGVVTAQDDFAIIREKLEKGLTRNKGKGEEKKKLNDWEAEELKKQMENLPENEKEIKEEMKEETLEHIWKLCQEGMVLQGINISVHRGAIDAFSYALTYN